MKKFICILLVLVSTFALALPAFAAQPETAVPYYTNASTATVTLTIDNDGVATVKVYCLGKAGTSAIQVTYYLDKQVGSSWSRVNIGTTNNQWTASSSSRMLSQTETVQLSSSGTYRATAIFEVTISTTETITITDEFTF